ncbi:MAG: hypothetical protein ACYDH1_12390 [Anaerolineaceae bacterium]
MLLNPCHTCAPEQSGVGVRRVLQTLARPARTSVNQTDERWFLLLREDASRCPARSSPTRG